VIDVIGGYRCSPSIRVAHQSRLRMKPGLA
jgi:hypothetical protein